MKTIMKLFGLVLFAWLVASAAVSFRPFDANGAEIAPRIHQAVIDDNKSLLFVLSEEYRLRYGTRDVGSTETFVGEGHRGVGTETISHDPGHDWSETGRVTLGCYTIEDLLLVLEPINGEDMQRVLAMRIQAGRCFYNPDGYPVMLVEVLTRVEGEGQRPTVELLTVEYMNGRRAYTWRLLGH